MSDSVVEQVIVHRMLPGSHERGHGAECVCGSQWDRWNDLCVKEDKETAEFRFYNFEVSVGENDGYIAVENNFTSAEVCFFEQQEVQETVTLSIEDLKKLIPAMQKIVDAAEKHGKK